MIEVRGGPGKSCNGDFTNNVLRRRQSIHDIAYKKTAWRMITNIYTEWMGNSQYCIQDETHNNHEKCSFYTAYFRLHGTGGVMVVR